MKNTTILIKSFLRFDCLLRLVQSIRRLYSLPIIIGDDSVSDDNEYKSYPEVDRIIKIPGVQWIRYPFDLGLSYVRNRMIEDCRTENVVLMDDDFVVDEECRIENMLNVLDENPNLGIVAGLVRHKNGYAYNWTGELHKKVLSSGKTAFDVRKLTSDWELTKKGVWFRRSHLVYNFFAARRDFLLQHKWDDEIKIVAEHLEFFLSLHKSIGGVPLEKYPVAYTPNSIVFNTFDMGKDSDPKPKRYRTYRGRVDYRNYVIQKHNLHNLPEGLAKLEIGIPKKLLTNSKSQTVSFSELSSRNVIILGVGHSGTTMLSRVLERMGWNLGSDIDEEFAEHVGVRKLNIQLCNNPNFSLPIPGCRRMIEHLQTPWAIKDPRFVFTLDQWREVLKKYNPILVWIVRNLSDVKDSYSRRGQIDEKGETNIQYMLSQGAKTIEDVFEKCKEQYDSWIGDKMILSYEKICEAAMYVSSFIKGRSEGQSSNPIQHTTPMEDQRLLIPKILHQIWLQGEDLIPAFMIRWMESWKRHHPDWDVYLWSEAKILKFLPERMQKVYNQLKYPSQKADFAGYYIVKEYGGVRADTDYEFFRSIEPIIQDCRAFVSFVKGDSPICAGIYGAVAGHSFLNELIVKICNMSNFSNRNIIGPRLVSEVVLSNRDVRVIEHSKLMPISWRERKRLLDFRPDDYGHPIAVHHYRQNPEVEFDNDPYRIECIHREDRVIGHSVCGPCGGGVKIKIFPCRKHGKCTLSKRVPEAACCAVCNDYSR